jgi:hypothetical protein
MRVAISASLLLVAGVMPAGATPPPAHDVPATALAHDEPGALEPFVALGTTPRRNVRLDFGFASIESGGADASSFAFTAGYTLAPEDGDFSLDMKLPFGSVEGFLLGDIGFDFRWRVLAAPSGTRAAIGFGFILPSVLLNSLGGGNDEIAQRRRDNEVYDQLDLFPLRYWEMSPYFVLSQRVGPLLITADSGLFFMLASKERNRYESPRPEFAVHYDLSLSCLLHREMLAAVLEVNGLSYVSDIAGDLKDGPTRDKGTGLGLTIGARFQPDPHIRLGLGLQVPIRGEDKLGRYDLTALYLHEVSVMAEVSFVILPPAPAGSPPRQAPR